MNEFSLKCLHFSLALNALTVSAPVFCAPASQKTVAWSFMAFATPYGRFKAVTTSDTTLVDNGVFHYSLKGPDFETFKVLNPENKTYIQTTITGYATQWTNAIKYPPLKKAGSGKLLDMECTRYTATLQPGTTIDAWYTTAIPMQKGLSNSFSKACSIPVGYGVPVKVTVSGQGKRTLLFELLKLTKTAIDPESLNVPKSYKCMKDHALFFLSDEDGKHTGIDEFMRWDPSSSKKTK